ncbi:hypothetical protein [Bradyrhizobium liaoningense]
MRRIFCYWRFLGPEQSIAGQIRAPQHKSAGDQREPELVLSGKKKAMEGLNGAPAGAVAEHALDIFTASAPNMCVAAITGQGSPI